MYKKWNKLIENTYNILDPQNNYKATVAGWPSVIIITENVKSQLIENIDSTCMVAYQRAIEFFLNLIFHSQYYFYFNMLFKLILYFFRIYFYLTLFSLFLQFVVWSISLGLLF